jgi:hypothetical protein
MKMGVQTYVSWHVPQQRQEGHHGPHNGILPRSGMPCQRPSRPGKHGCPLAPGPAVHLYARLASLTCRSRALARRTLTLQHAMSLIGTVYNCCTPQASLARDDVSPGPSAGPGRALGPGTPTASRFPARPWGLAAAVMDRAKYPVAIGLLGAVRVALRAEHLAHLVHQLEAGSRSPCRVILILTFHNLGHNITICGNQQGKTQYMDSQQAHFPDRTINITIRGKSAHLYGVISQTTFR